MEKKVINVIEVIEGAVSSVDSFIIPDDSQEKEIVARAEKLFGDKCKENGVGEDSVEECIEDGYFSQGDYHVSLTWSNVQ